MNIHFNSKVFVFVVALAAITAIQPAQAQVSNGSDDGSVVSDAPSSASGSTAAVSNGSDDGIGATAPVVPGPASDSTVSVSNGGDDAPSAPAPVAPVTPSGSTFGGSSSGSGSFSGGSIVLVQAAVPTVSTTSCPLITTFMKLGSTNDGSEVAKLQAFLKGSEKLDVEVNGKFDDKTESAVRAFQTKYMLDIMGPWSATRSSGIVYITTIKKVNELACATPLTLSQSDISIIDAYRQNLAQSSAGTSDIGVNDDAAATSTVGTTDIGNSSDNTANTAAVGNATMFQRFLKFLRDLF